MSTKERYQKTEYNLPWSRWMMCAMTLYICPVPPSFHITHPTVPLQHRQNQRDTLEIKGPIPCPLLREVSNIFMPTGLQQLNMNPNSAILVSLLICACHGCRDPCVEAQLKERTVWDNNGRINGLWLSKGPSLKLLP